MKTSNLIFIIIVAVIAGFFLRTVILPCNENVTSNDTIIVERVVRDTIYQDVPKPVNVVHVLYDTVLVPTTIYQPVKVPADTMAILADYYAIREYQDTLIDNSDVYIHLSEKVSRNALYGRKLIYETRCQDQIINHYPNRLYFGGAVSYTGDVNIYLSAGYQREKYLYVGGFNNRGFMFSVMRSF